jgi:hypothetical protein
MANVRFVVLTSVTFFWDMIPWSLVDFRRLEHTTSIRYLHDEDSTFLRKIGKLYHATWSHIPENSELQGHRPNSFQFPNIEARFDIVSNKTRKHIARITVFYVTSKVYRKNWAP